MKLKLLLTFTALVLALCFTLAACGEQQTGGATADSATADSATPDSAAAIAEATAPQSAATSAPAKEEVSSASSSAASSKSGGSPAPVVNNDAQDISYDGEIPAQEEKQEEEQHSSNSAPAPQTSSKASSQASSKSSGNPAYSEDEKPVYTISLTNKNTKKTYTASCSYTDDKEEVAYAAFFLPGGEYEAVVYHYSESKDKGEPLAKTTFKNSIAEDKRKTFHVKYLPKENKIEVEVSVSSRNQ